MSIIVRQRENNFDNTVLTLSVVVPHDLDQKQLEKLVEQFRKITQSHNTLPCSRILPGRNYYVEEALALPGDILIESLIACKFIRSLPSGSFSYDNSLMTDHDIDKKENSLRNIHKSLGDEKLAFEDFCKKIVLSWEKMSY